MAMSELALLSGRYRAESLVDLLLPREEWHPFPAVQDRAAWEALTPLAREALCAGGERALEQIWPHTLAVRYLDYARDGNRSRYEEVYFRRRGMLAGLALAECIEGRGRYLDEIANGVWLICEESSWCLPAHVSGQRMGIGLPDTTEPIVDLFAAETSALLAWVDYLLGARLDDVSPLIRPHVRREIDVRVLTPCLERDDFWWMGFTPREVNNWNPWINSNWLASALLIESDPERRVASVYKSMRSLDRFLGPYPRDGGCDEGPGYWGRAGASLLDCLELLYSATGGQVDIYDDPLVREIGRFIYRVQIEGRYLVNFADASAIVGPPPAVVYRYGQRIGDADLMALGAWLAADQDLLHPVVDRMGSLGRTLPALFSLQEMLSVEPRQPLPRDVWLNEVQVMVARDRAGSSAGLYVAAKGGHNGESHNHNDVGSFLVYVDGWPLLVDAGVETYTRKTFSPQRYEIWTMQSAYHNLLPTVDGVQQAPGRSFTARDVDYIADGSTACFSLDIAGAYPPEAKLESWRRTIALRRGQEVEIVDVYELEEPAAEISLSLLTPCTVCLGAPGQVILSEAPLPNERRAGGGVLSYDAERFALTTETIAISDDRLGGVWGEGLTRLVFTARNPAQQDTWTFRVRA
ncbi:MAG: heparinase II/III family protein [Anaerolineae bacterium]|nr:heparinase II/III family protein [Anaerolineae bacterium]